MLTIPHPTTMLSYRAYLPETLVNVGAVVDALQEGVQSVHAGSLSIQISPSTGDDGAVDATVTRAVGTQPVLPVPVRLMKSIPVVVLRCFDPMGAVIAASGVALLEVIVGPPLPTWTLTLLLLG